MKKTNESGRSMIEMLGVLAIITVLSVGSFAAYTIAMNRHRSNETITRLMKRAIVVSGQRALGQDGSLSGFSETDGVYTISSTVTNATGANTDFQISVSSIPQAVCDRIKSMDWKVATISDDCSTFTFNNNLTERTSNGGAEAGDNNDDSHKCSGAQLWSEEQERCVDCDPIQSEECCQAVGGNKIVGGWACCDSQYRSYDNFSNEFYQDAAYYCCDETYDINATCCQLSISSTKNQLCLDAYLSGSFSSWTSEQDQQFAQHYCGYGIYKDDGHNPAWLCCQYGGSDANGNPNKTCCEASSMSWDYDNGTCSY